MIRGIALAAIAWIAFAQRTKLAVDEARGLARDVRALIAAFEPGEYRLVVQLKDEIAGTALERRSSVRVAP